MYGSFYRPDFRKFLPHNILRRVFISKHAAEPFNYSIQFFKYPIELLKLEQKTKLSQTFEKLGACLCYNPAHAIYFQVALFLLC